MLVRDAMTAPAVCLRADDTLERASAVLVRHRLASAPVRDADDAVVGVVSGGDLLRGRVRTDPGAQPRLVGGVAPGCVADVMTSCAVVVRPGDDLAAAGRVLVDAGVRCAPVVAGRSVVGVLSRHDLQRSLARRHAPARPAARPGLGPAGPAAGGACGPAAP